MLLWIWIAVVVVGLVILASAAVRLVGRLANLQRAVTRLLGRQAEAEKLGEGAAALQQTLLGLQDRTQTMQERLAVLSPGADTR